MPLDNIHYSVQRTCVRPYWTCVQGPCHVLGIVANESWPLDFFKAQDFLPFQVLGRSPLTEDRSLGSSIETELQNSCNKTSARYCFCNMDCLSGGFDHTFELKRNHIRLYSLKRDGTPYILQWAEWKVGFLKTCKRWPHFHGDQRIFPKMFLKLPKLNEILFITSQISLGTRKH